MINSDYSVDKVNGQVLFKISKKNAIDILAMDTRVFYITRVYEVTDSSGSRVISSDEEVLYTGQWKDETSNTVDDYTSQIKALMATLEERNNQIKALQNSNVQLIEQNAKYAAQVADLQDENTKLTTQTTELEAKLAEYQSGNEYDGVIIDGNSTHHTIITGRTLNGNEYTEEQLAEALKTLKIDAKD